MNKNKIYELLNEGKVTDAVNILLESLEGPELDNKEKELENEATVEAKPEELEADVDNKDVYPEDEHKEVEEVKEVMVEEVENVATKEKAPETMEQKIDNETVYDDPEHKEEKDVEQVMVEEVENVATEEKEPEAMKPEIENDDVFCDETHKEAEEVKEVVVEDAVVEDVLETNPEVKKAEDLGVASEEEAEVGEVKEELPVEEKPATDEVAAEVEKLLDVTEKDTEQPVEEKPEELSESMKAIFGILDRINEEVQVAAGPELKEPKELENEATDENKAEEKAEEKENKDVYPEDEHKEVEEVKEVVVEAATRTYKTQNVPGASHVRVEKKYYDDGDERRVAEKRVAVDEVDGSEEIISQDDKPNSGKSGRKYGSLKEELENEATEEKEPETMEQEVDNEDVFKAPEHKEVEDVVEVVVEAAKLCSENGIPATLENITKYAKTLFESEAVALKVEEPAEKEYDVDAAVESSEMNGNKEEFEEYEDIQGEGAEAAKDEEAVVEPKDIQETVRYNSLREACLLEDGYFDEDTFSIQTADEKQAKLLEQVSLLLAREANDPLYEELLRASITAKRLHEACLDKYLAEAQDRSDRIQKKKKLA